MNNDNKECRYETQSFLLLCGKKDIGFLGLPQKKRKTEDYARLISITQIFGFKKVSIKIIAAAGNRIDEVYEYLGKIKNDYTVINNWMNDFISNITIAGLKEAAEEEWQRIKKTVNKTDFRFADIIIEK